MAFIRYRQPIRLFKSRSYLLLKVPVDVTIVIDERTSYEIPYQAGLYGYDTAIRRDNAVNRFNRTSGLDEVAVPVIPTSLQGL